MILDLIRTNPGAAMKLAFRRGHEFTVGWNEGVLRYRNSKGSGLIPGSMYLPKADPASYAASEAAVAYCIAMERTR